MLYESIRTTQGITVESGHILFSRGDDRGPGKKPFGEFNSANQSIQKTLGLTEAELDEIIEDSDLYKRGEAGKYGIWRKTIRRSASEKKKQMEVLADAFKLLDEATLRAYIANHGADCPIEATHEALVDLAIEATQNPPPAAVTSAKGKPGRKKAQPIEEKAQPIEEPTE